MKQNMVCTLLAFVAAFFVSSNSQANTSLKQCEGTIVINSNSEIDFFSLVSARIAENGEVKLYRRRALYQTLIGKGTVSKSRAEISIELGSDKSRVKFEVIHGEGTSAEMALKGNFKQGDNILEALIILDCIRIDE